MLPAPHAHLQSVFVVIILSHDGRLKGILSLLSRQHHQRSHGQGCSLQPDTRQVLSRLNVQVRLFTRNGMLRYQYVHNGGTASGTVVNSDGWQIVKNGGVAGNTTVNQKGRLQVDAGGTATNVTLKQGGALVTSTAATVTGINRLGAFSVVEGKADNVVLENGGRLDVLTGHTATNTRVDDGGTLDVRNGGTATTVSMGNGGVLLADSGAAVSGSGHTDVIYSTSVCHILAVRKSTLLPIDTIIRHQVSDIS